MNIFFYLILFMMGATFGSFFTLAVYRIPLHQDITHKRSFCPNCQHRLSGLDLIPIISYIALGAKCRYCKKPIRPRYFILEIMSGFVFVLLGLSVKLNIFNLQISTLAYLGFTILYLCAIIIIAGIDKERKEINKPVLLYGLIVAVVYMIYLYVLEKANIYRYVIYLALTVILLIIQTIYLRKKAEYSYVLDILMLSMLMIICTGEYVYFLTVIFTLMAVALYTFISQIKASKNKAKKDEKSITADLPFGFIMTVANIIMLLYVNFMVVYF